MPLSCLYIENHSTRNHINSINEISFLIKEILLEMSPNTNTCFAAFFMPMNGHYRPWFKGV